MVKTAKSRVGNQCPGIWYPGATKSGILYQVSELSDARKSARIQALFLYTFVSTGLKFYQFLSSFVRLSFC